MFRSVTVDMKNTTGLPAYKLFNITLIIWFITVICAALIVLVPIFSILLFFDSFMTTVYQKTLKIFHILKNDSLQDS